MTPTTRKALPWLLSLGTHGAALAAIAILLALSPRPIPGGLIDISLVGGTGFGGGGAPARPGTQAGSRGLALPARPSSRASTAAARPGSGSPAAAGARENAAQPDTYSLRASRQAAASTDAAAVSASDVLSDVAAAAPSAGPAVGSIGSRADAGPGGSPGVLAGATQWGWQGPPRRLVRKRDPEFPALLSAIGQEVEGEARITVAPSGIVTRVEITRGTGYIEIDAIVGEALHDYLFSRADGSVDSTGTVKFRFRLERQD